MWEQGLVPGAAAQEFSGWRCDAQCNSTSHPIALLLLGALKEAILILSNVGNVVNAAQVWPGLTAGAKYSEQEIHVNMSIKHA